MDKHKVSLCSGPGGTEFEGGVHFVARILVCVLLKSSTLYM